MQGGTLIPRNECPGGHFFQWDSHSNDNGYHTSERSFSTMRRLFTYLRSSMTEFNQTECINLEEVHVAKKFIYITK